VCGGVGVCVRTCSAGDPGPCMLEFHSLLKLAFNFVFSIFFFIYSYVHTLFGPFLPPAPRFLINISYYCIIIYSILFYMQYIVRFIAYQ
jgi:hypothetical protein